jgi:hypothetical protein
MNISPPDIPSSLDIFPDTSPDQLLSEVEEIHVTSFGVVEVGTKRLFRWWFTLLLGSPTLSQKANSR